MDEFRKYRNFILSNDVTVRQLQLKLLEIFKYFKKICEENNLTYWCGGGTMLGAVRHKGFIPWDDDADVIVTKDNFYVFKLCLSFSPTVSVPEKHIKFLLSATHDINKVYIPCLNFEKSHHREMIKAFHRYEEDLLKLNDKLYEWKNYNSIPMPTIAFNQY